MQSLREAGIRYLKEETCLGLGRDRYDVKVVSIPQQVVSELGIAVAKLLCGRAVHIMEINSKTKVRSND